MAKSDLEMALEQAKNALRDAETALIDARQAFDKASSEAAHLIFELGRATVAKR